MSLLEINNVSLAFPSLDRPVLETINYQVSAHDFIIILGSNGSGKSSLLKLLDRRYQTTSGNILLHDKKIDHYASKLFSKKITTLTQNAHDSLFISLTLFENYLLVKERYTKSFFISRSLRERQFFADYLQAYNPNLSHKLDQTVEKLSGGEKQALALALSMLHPPGILLLDEHTSALDPKSATQIMMLTQAKAEEHGITCILTTHDMDIALQYGNRILALKQGQVHQAIDEKEKKKLTREKLLVECY